MTIMADLEVNFKAEAFYRDNLKGEIAVFEIAEYSCTFCYRIRNQKTGKEILRARTRMVFYDYNNQKRMNVPEQIRQRLF